MLLFLSSGAGERPDGLGSGQSRKYFPGYVALEAPDDLGRGEPFSRPSSQVVPGGFEVSQAHDGDDVGGAVGGTITASVEAVATTRPAAAGRLWETPQSLANVPAAGG